MPPRIPTADDAKYSSFAYVTLLACWTLGWLLTHRYFGIYHDAVLYTLQALNRINPATYGNDLFFRFGSQDSFTIFTAIYAQMIERLGTTAAGIIVVIACSAGLGIAAWFIARRLMTHRLAWLSVGLFLVIPAHYGAFLVFKVDEEFVSARLPAEVVLLAAVAAFIFDRRAWAWFLVLLGGFLHPLMTIPVAATLALLALPSRYATPAIVAAAAAVGLLCVVATIAPVGRLALMDKAWLDVVHLRSNYLFLEHWPARYFERLALLFATLALAHSASGDATVRRLIRAVGTVCVGGLLATLVTQFVPAILLIQLQPWRALWVATVLAILAIPLVVASLWRSTRADRAAAVLLICAWMLQDASSHAVVLALIALGLRLLPEAAKSRYVVYITAFAALAAAITFAWTAATGFSALSIDLGFRQEQAAVERLRTLFGLEAAGMTAVFLAWWLISNARRVSVRVFASVGLLVACVPLSGFAAWAQWIEPTQRHESKAYFADWRQIVPPGSQVMWLWDPISTWMLLERPSYVSYAQASGVIFSRDTAMTAARRADNLAPVARREFVLGAIFTDENLPKPLTTGKLRSICRDPDLDFVVSEDDVDVHAPSKEWPVRGRFIHLYDCRPFRAGFSLTPPRTARHAP